MARRMKALPVLPSEIIGIIFEACDDNDTIAKIRVCCKRYAATPYLKQPLSRGGDQYVAIHSRNSMYISDGEWVITKTKFVSPNDTYYRFRVRNKWLRYQAYYMLRHGYDDKTHEHYYYDVNTFSTIIRMYRNTGRGYIKYIVYIDYDNVKYLTFRTDVSGDELTDFDVKLRD